MATVYDWDLIKKEYITGDITYEKLCEKFGVKRFKTLAEKASEEGWVSEREKYREEVQRIALQKNAEKKAKKMQKDEKKVDKACDKLLDKLIKIIDITHTAGGIKNLTEALQNIQRIKGIKSEDDRKEQSARIKNLLHQVEKDEEKGPETVKIIIAGDEEYAQ